MEMQGCLVLDYRSFRVTDGIEYWKVLSPSLLFRLIYKKRKRDGVCGRWLVKGNWVIWFKKEKWYNETSITKEKLYYKRGDIKC